MEFATKIFKFLQKAYNWLWLNTLELVFLDQFLSLSIAQPWVNPTQVHAI